MNRILILIISVVLFALLLSDCGGDEITGPDNDPSVTIISPKDDEAFAEGDTVDFAGVGRERQGGELPDSMLIWVSDKDDTIGVGSCFARHSLTVNRHLITLMGVDSRGRTGWDNITIEVISIPPGFVPVHAGSFVMGSPEEEPGRESNEGQHEVTLTRDFFISAEEVSNRQYADMAQWAYDNGCCTVYGQNLLDALDGSNKELLDLASDDCDIFFSGGGFAVKGGKGSCPVMEVSWYGAVAYCDWLSLRQGFARAYDHSSWKCRGQDPYNAPGYRLPTEAEWEYSCRGNSTTAFANGEITGTGCGDTILDEIAWYCGNSTGRVHLTGQLIPNHRDLYDMHGNAWEWCNDWYGGYGGDATDPVGPAAGDRRVIRGGAWLSESKYCRSANRSSVEPDYSINGIGFRVCRSISVH